MLKHLFQPSLLTLALSTAVFPAHGGNIVAEHGENQALEHITLPEIQVRRIVKQTASNYTVPSTNASAGIRLTQRETPQSLSVITEKQIADQGLDTLQDVLKQVPGVYHSKMGNNATGDSEFISRGLAIDTISIDGANKLYYDSKAIRRSTNNLDSALYEQIAVVRGSSGLSNGGLGDASGTISLTRKKPTAKPAVSLEAGAGSWRHYRFVLDAGGALNIGNTLRGRIIAINDRGGDYLPDSHRHNQTLYGILSYDVSPQTQFSLGTEIHRNRNRGSSRFSYLTVAGNSDDGYRPFDADARNNSSAHWAYGNDNSTETFISSVHELDNGWQLNGHYSHTSGKSDYLSGIAGTYEIASDYSSFVSADRSKNKKREHNIKLTLDGSYRLFGRDHEFNTGISYFDGKDTPSFYEEKDIPIADIRRFDGNITQPELAYLRDGVEQTRNLSLYGSTRFKLTDRLSLISGGRWLHWDYRYRNNRNRFADGRDTQTVFIPYLGTTFDLTPQLTAYTGYTTVFRPQTYYLNIEGNPLKPMRGNTYEAGLKAAWYEGRLNAAAAVFTSKRNNIAIRAGRRTNGESYYRAADHTDTKGWEISLNGRINPRWLLNASYARSVIKDSSGIRIKTSKPVHQFKLFSAYDFTDRLTLGSNLVWQSKTDTTDEYPTDISAATAAALSQKSYAVLDLTAHYKLGKNTRLSLDWENVFDKRYKTMPDIHVYGTPRSLTATLKHTF